MKKTTFPLLIFFLIGFNCFAQFDYELVQNTVQIPDEVIPGTPFTITYQVRNIGDSNAPICATWHGVRNGANTTNIASRTTSIVPALGVNEITTVSTQVTIPSDYSGNTFRINMTTGFRNEWDPLIIDSPLTANNSFLSPEINIAQFDYELVQNTVQIPNDAIPGVPFTITYQVRNIGDIVAPDCTTRHWLKDGSNTQNISTITESYVPSLGVNEVTTVSTQLTLPTSYSGSTFRISLFTGYRHSPGPIDVPLAGNNSFLSPEVNIVKFDYELVQNTVQIPDQVISGTPFTITYQVRNVSDRNAPACFTWAVLRNNSNSTTISSKFVSSVPALEANEVAAISMEAIVPSSYSGSSFRVSMTTGFLNPLQPISLDSPLTENNSFLSSEIDLLQFPDLTISNAGSISSTQIGNSTSLSGIRVNNAGSASSPSTNLKAYLSTNQSTSNATLLGSVNVPSLEAGSQSNSLQINGAIPSSLSEGNYNLILVVDEDNVVDDELNEDNNTSSISVNLTLPRPDLVISSSGNIQGTQIGENMTVSNIRVRNDGSLSSSNTNVKAYISANQSTNNAIFLGSANVSALNAGSQSNSLQISGTIPSSLSEGSYNLILVVDEDNIVANESNESNNTSSSNVFLSNAQPDLIISNEGSVTGDLIGQSISISGIRVQNIGQGNAGATNIKAYISSNTSTNSSGLIGSQNVSSLNSGQQTNSIQISGTIPSGLSEGTYNLILIVDEDNTVNNESNENNNTSVTPISLLEPKPDLQINSGSADGQVFQNQTLNWNCTLQNSGEGSVVNNYLSVRLYLSTNNTLDGNDYLVSESGTNNIAAGQFVQISGFGGIPSNNVSPGNYFAIFVVDQLDNIEEEVENNNIHIATGNVIVNSSGRRKLQITLRESNFVEQDYSVEIYPNPALENQNIFITTLEQGSLKISDAQGRLVKFTQLNKGINAIDISEGVANGIYFFRIETQTGVTSKKILIKK